MNWQNVKKIEFTEEICGKIWDILVKLGGAYEGERDAFKYSHMREKHPTQEYRFCGNLGFGGKFRNDCCVPVSDGKRLRGQWFVNCYREDETKERLIAIEKINEALLALEDEYA